MFHDMGGCCDPNMKHRYRRTKNPRGAEDGKLRQASRNKP